MQQHHNGATHTSRSIQLKNMKAYDLVFNILHEHYFMIYCELCIYNDSFKKNISYLLHKLITLDNNSISCPNRYEFCRRNTTTRISSRRISSSNYYSYYYSASSSYWRNDLRGLAGLYRLSRLILLDIQSMLQ